MQAADMADLAFKAVVGANRVFTSEVQWVWIVEAKFRKVDDDTIASAIYVAEAPLDQRPDADSLIPEGAELMRDVSFPASQFVDMTQAGRDRHRPHYRAYLTFVVAKARGKTVEQLVRGVDYEPDSVDDQVVAWSRVIPSRRVL
jgi:predicted choloylglycine hydrolase